MTAIGIMLVVTGWLMDIFDAAFRSNGPPLTIWLGGVAKLMLALGILLVTAGAATLLWKVMP